MSNLESLALAMLRDDPETLDDARRFARVGNSVAGSVLSLTTRSPRWATERAVAEAVAALDAERRKP